jgi:hypothetical protein
MNLIEINIVTKEAVLCAFLEGELNDRINSARFAINEMRINKAKFLDMKQTCDAIIETDCFGVYHSKVPINTWHDIARELAFDFQVAMHPNNPTLQMGLSNAGPMQRFVAAVVPHITGERPNVLQVGKHLKDHPPRLLHREGWDNTAA